MDNPPVNALTVAGWFELADVAHARSAATRAVRVVVLRAEGRGFNAGVDIKEMQATEGFDALIGANRGCFAAFAAVYECAVPVIAAVNGFCLGGGIGLVGNADVIVASDDATFGLPEVDRGALGAATHLTRLVPQHKMRAMVYTSATATAAELHHFGSVLAGRAAGRAARRGDGRGRADRGQVAHGDPGGQGVAQRHRPVGREAQLPLRAGLHLRAQPRPAWPTSTATPSSPSATRTRPGDDGAQDKRLHRGRRRRRAAVGHDDRHRRLGIAAQADVDRAGHPALRPHRPHGRQLRRARRRPAVRGRQGASALVYAFVSLDSIPLEPHFRAARQAGAIEDEPYDEGMFLLGLQAAAWRVPFLPTAGRPRLRPPARQRPRAHWCTLARTTTARSWSPCRRSTLDAAFVHLNRADARGNGQYLGPDLYFDDLFLGAATQRFLSAERIVPTEELRRGGPAASLLISRLHVDGVVEAPNGAHFTSCVPDYERDEAFQKEYAASAKSPEAWAEFRAAWLDLERGRLPGQAPHGRRSA